MTIVPGALVQARGEAWMVTRAEPIDRGSLVTLEGRGRGNAGRRLRLLTAFDRVESSREDRRPRRRRRDLVARVALTALASRREAAGLWTAAAADMALLGWQLEPALAAVGGASRVLLADGVGLGKTLQAGLIASELMARGFVDRVLVLAPAGLRLAWAGELASRFHLRASIFDHDALVRAGAAAPAGVNPWTTAPLIVSSIDLVKRADVRPAVEAALFDLLIVDEAHHLTPGSDRGAAVERLAARVPWLVLASATPHTGDDRAFAFLSGLGAVDPSDQLAVFRRGREAVGLHANRSTHPLAVAPTAEERALIDAVHEYARLLWRAGGRGGALALVAATLARRAASSALAIQRTLERRLVLVRDDAPAAPERQAPLPWEELDDADALEAASWLGTPGMDDAAAEAQWIQRLIALAVAAAPAASKTACLRRLMRRIAEPMVVFTEFRDTLDALAVALDGAGAEVIHGGLEPPARAAAIERFTAGGASLLLATDAAGEGLNLHHRCRLVVTMEWPWSPLRLEQRIGRVDRIGQARRVHAVHLYHRGTVEDTVLARLSRRRDRAEQAMGALAGEADVAGMVFDDVTPASGNATGNVAPARASAPPVDRHIALAIEGERQALALRQVRADAAPCWSTPRHAARRLAALYEVTLVSRGGNLVDRRVAALGIELQAPPATRAGWQRVMNLAAADSRVLEAASGAARRLAARDSTHPDLSGVIRRIGLMRKRLRESRPGLLQASLFDERAIRAASLDREALRRIDEHLARRAHQLTDTAEVLTGAAAGDAAVFSRLIAAWRDAAPEGWR